MNSIFVANFLVGEKEGIYKKIYAEAKALAKMNGECYLVLKNQNGCKVITLSDGSENEYKIGVLRMVKKLIEEKTIRMIYVRAMIPTPLLINVLRTAKKKKIRIIYEIPTYPYFTEMYRMAIKKYRAIIKIALDVVFNPLIFYYAERILIIKSNSQKKVNKKMFEICNGVDVEKIQSKSYSEKKKIKELNMVAVGTIYPYHGYDRLIEGMRQYNEKIDDIYLNVHFIGSSDTMNELKDLAKRYKLKRVFFHGEKTTEEMNKMYENFDIGIGCIGLHRKNADIDTSLKVIEYYCRGVPVVSSGRCSENNFTLNVEADDSPINMKNVVDFYSKIEWDELINFSNKAKEKYSWDSILMKALE